MLARGVLHYEPSMRGLHPSTACVQRITFSYLMILVMKFLGIEQVPYDGHADAEDQAHWGTRTEGSPPLPAGPQLLSGSGDQHNCRVMLQSSSLSWICRKP